MGLSQLNVLEIINAPYIAYITTKFLEVPQDEVSTEKKNVQENCLSVSKIR